MKTKRSKDCDIPKKVKDEVWERDNHRCIICGTPSAMANCHFESREHGGLWIPENTVTACMHCQNDYNFGDKETRLLIEETISAYLESHYPDWDDSELYYKKWAMR